MLLPLRIKLACQTKYNYGRKGKQPNMHQIIDRTQNQPRKRLMLFLHEITKAFVCDTTSHQSTIYISTEYSVTTHNARIVMVRKVISVQSEISTF